MDPILSHQINSALLCSALLGAKRSNALRNSTSIVAFMMLGVCVCVCVCALCDLQYDADSTWHVMCDTMCNSSTLLIVTPPFFPPLFHIPLLFSSSLSVRSFHSLQHNSTTFLVHLIIAQRWCMIIERSKSQKLTDVSCTHQRSGKWYNTADLCH